MTLLIYQTLRSGWDRMLDPTYIPWNGKALRIEAYPPPYASFYDLLNIFLNA